MLPNPCVLGGPQHKGQNQKWLPHRFFSRAHKRAQMIAGHRDAEDAHQAGWPRVSSRPTPLAGTAPPPPRWLLPGGVRDHPHVLLAPRKLWHPP